MNRRDDLDVLLIEGDPDNRALVREILSEITLGDDQSCRCRPRDALTLADGLAALRESPFDVILLSLNLPDAAGLESLQRVLEAQTQAPVLVLTDIRDETTGIAAVKEGAQDFLAKWQLDADRLGRAIAYAIERHRMRREVALKTRELSASEDRLRRLIASSVDGIVITDPAGTIIFANPAAEALFSRRRAILIGSPVGVPVDGSRTELELHRPDGAIVTAEMRVASMDWQGAPARLATFRDITAHKETLRQLDETRLRQLMVRDHFLSHVSHELRTPLTVAQQWASLLKDGLVGPVTAEQGKALETVLRNCRHLEKLIEDLLEATRSNNGKLRVDPLRTRLAGLAEDAVASVRTAQRSDAVALRVELPAQLPDLLADPDRVRQVLINLLSNAVKFTPAGGTVTLTAAPDSEVPGELRVSVTDTGCGIPPEELERIFEHLYQRDMGPEVSRKGLGLGLYICRQIVTGHGGRIWVDSEPGRGSTFHFTVPIFSTRALLSRLPAPGMETDTLCLVGVQARPGGGGVLQGFEIRYLDGVRQVVGSCLMPDRDLLLPRLNCDEHGELMFIVAAADLPGAEVLARRLRRQLATARDADRANLEFHVEAAPLVVPPRAGRPAGIWLDDVAVALESGLERMTASAGRPRP